MFFVSCSYQRIGFQSPPTPQQLFDLTEPPIYTHACHLCDWTSRNTKKPCTHALTARPPTPCRMDGLLAHHRRRPAAGWPPDGEWGDTGAGTFTKKFREQHTSKRSRRRKRFSTFGFYDSYLSLDFCLLHDGDVLTFHTSLSLPEDETPPAFLAAAIYTTSHSATSWIHSYA